MKAYLFYFLFVNHKSAFLISVLIFALIDAVENLPNSDLNLVVIETILQVLDMNLDGTELEVIIGIHVDTEGIWLGKLNLTVNFDPRSLLTFVSVTFFLLAYSKTFTVFLLERFANIFTNTNFYFMHIFESKDIYFMNILIVERR